MAQVVTTDEQAGFIAVDNEWIGQRVCTYIANQQPVLGYVRSWKPAEPLVKQAFDAVDADGSGLLDRDEIRALLENLGRRPTEADIDEAMSQLDTDSSGEVDFAEFSAYWEANFGSNGDKNGGILQGLTVDLSEPLWRVLLDSGKCIELSGDRVLSALTQYETLLPRLLSDLDLALQNITLIEPHLSRAQLNAAVLWATEWGLEHHPLAHQVKSAARNLKEQLCAEQLSALAAQAEQCVAAVADWGWRSNRLGKLRFDQSFAPAPVNLLDRENFDVKVTSSGPAYPPIMSLADSDALANGTSPDDGYLRWQALATAQQADQERCAAVSEALDSFLSNIGWIWDPQVQRIDKDTAASGKAVAQRDVMTGKILKGEWRLEKSLQTRWASVIEAVKAAWEKTMHPWEREGSEESEDDESDTEEGVQTAVGIEANDASEDKEDNSDENEDIDSDLDEEDEDEDEEEGDGWTEHVHPGTGRSYYVNASTKETTWIKPTEVDDHKRKQELATTMETQEDTLSPVSVPHTSKKTSTTETTNCEDSSNATESATGSKKKQAPSSSAARAAAQRRRSKRASRIKARNAMVSGDSRSGSSEPRSGGASRNKNTSTSKDNCRRENIVVGAGATAEVANAAVVAPEQKTRSRPGTSKAKSRAARIAARKKAATSKDEKGGGV